MSRLRSVLELGLRQTREGGPALPESVLSNVLAISGAPAGVLGQGELVLARQGSADGPIHRIELPAGRDAFWLELGADQAVDEELRLSAGMVLGSWLVRQELKKARFAERRRLWEVESLRAIAEGLGGTLEQTRIADELLLHAPALLDARRGEVWLGGAAGSVPIGRVEGAVQTGLCADGSCVIAARVGGAVLTAAEAASLPDDGLLESYRIAVPIVGRRGRLGVLALAEREVRGGIAPFGPTDAETLSLFASQAAVALENAILHQQDLERERLDREIELAAVVQRELLPATLPTLPGFEISARNVPSRRVGGDVYEATLTQRGLFLLLGDVAGKGLAAALMAASLQAAVRVLLQGCPPVDELTRQLHQHFLSTTPANKFATVFLGYLREDGRLNYVSAGHNPVVIVPATGDVELLYAGGPPLGLLSGIEYQAETVTLRPGSALVAYTDGLSEAFSPTDEEFGFERIAAIAGAARGRSTESIADEIFSAVEEHTVGAPPHDDRTVLIVRRHPA
jgi:serine phosphatase RsbU (regulator of sigma subunit)